MAGPSFAFGSSTVKPAAIDLLCRMRPLSLERADALHADHARNDGLTAGRLACPRTRVTRALSSPPAR